MEDNAKLAEKTGNQLTQLMDDDGKLVNVREVDFDQIPDETVLTEPAYASADVRNALFEKHNIKTSETSQSEIVSDEKVSESTNELVEEAIEEKQDA